MNPTFANALGVARLSVVSLKITVAAGDHRASPSQRDRRGANAGDNTRKDLAASR